MSDHRHPTVLIDRRAHPANKSEEASNHDPPANDGTSALVDYYKELSVDRDLSIAELQEKIQELKALWGRRASIVGKRGDQARETLALLDEALATFSDEDSKERYDRALRMQGSTEDEATVNWVARAWTYYFGKDYGPARVAARKARQHNGDDPTAHVVSAWIELAEEEAKRAEEYASEAYVLDELGEDTFDVHEVRGATFFAVGKYSKSVEAFNRALTRASELNMPPTLWRLSLAQYSLGLHEEALTSCLRALRNEEYIVVDKLRPRILHSAYESIKAAVRYTSIPQRQSILNKTRAVVWASDASEQAKWELLTFIDKWIEKTYLEARTQTPPVQPNDSDRPDFPLITTGIAVFFLLVFFGYPHIITLLLFAAPAGWVGYWFYQKREFDKKVQEYAVAKMRYEADERRISTLSAEIDRLIPKI